MKRTLVTYFSATGVTASVAKKLSHALKADLAEIQPEIPYTTEDLDWRNKESRSSIEMKNPESRPAIKESSIRIEDYDTIFVGFPIWWYVAPTIVQTFLENYDLSNKTIIPFATSGGSNMGNTNENLSKSCKNAKLLEGKVFSQTVLEEELLEWAEEIHDEQNQY